MSRFEFIEHTADEGVRVYGSSIEELFENSALALFSLITKNKSRAKKERNIDLRADKLEDLLVDWLNELISLFFSYGFFPSDYKIKISQDSCYSLNASVRGAEFDFQSNELNTEVKAATYHNVKIDKSKDGYKVDIVFDV